MSGAARRKAALRVAGYWLLRIVMVAVRVMPFGMALALGRALGTLVRLVSRKRYRVAIKNLRIAYGDAMTPAERDRTARASFRHFGMFGVEMILFAFMSTRDVWRRVQVEGSEHLDAALAAGKGCLVISAHLGSFEAGARWFVSHGTDFVALARRTRDRATTDLMTSLRARNGIDVLTIDRSMRPVLKRLRSGGCIAIVCDQNTDDLFIPFFGHDAGTASGPAVLALRTGAPIVYTFTYRDSRGGYRTVIDPPWVPERTGDDDADIRAIMTAVNQRFEEAIRACPEQWLWFHDRWRLSPINREMEAAGEA